MHALSCVSSQQLVSVLFTAVPTNTKKFQNFSLFFIYIDHRIIFFDLQKQIILHIGSEYGHCAPRLCMMQLNLATHDVHLAIPEILIKHVIINAYHLYVKQSLHEIV